MNDPAGAWYTVNEEMLADHQVIKADQIVEKLRSMYFTRVSRLVVEFGTVLEDIIELKHSLAVAESFVKEKTVKV